jgi:hypothetical protein
MFGYMTANIKKIILRLEFILLCVIPWGSYISLNWFYFERVHSSTIALGWSFLFVHQIIGSALLFHKREEKKGKNIHQWLLVFIFLILILHQLLTKKSLVQFLFEKTVLDAISVATVFILGLFFFKNSKGRTAWQDLGVLPLFVGGIIMGGCWQFVDIYLELLYSKNVSWLSYLQISAVFLMTIISYLIALRPIIKGKVVLEDIFEGRYSMILILGQLFFWLSMPGWVYLLKLIT